MYDAADCRRAAQNILLLEPGAVYKNIGKRKPTLSLDTSYINFLSNCLSFETA